MAKRRIAILGAGPIGLEAALLGKALGHDVTVLERGRAGENLLDWGHVRLFSPFHMNCSSLGARTLRARGHALPQDAAYLSGREHVERYLWPLARTLEGSLREGTTVVQVGRESIGKGLLGEQRRAHPFRLLLEQGGRESVAHADVVLDCSGSYGNHNWLGSGNVPAIGERALHDRIAYRLEDLAGAARERYQGCRVLLVGAGLSAATALDALLQLRDTTVVWVTRSAARAPLPTFANDPLPERARLVTLANELASGADPRVERRAGAAIERLEARGSGFLATLSQQGHETTVADRVLAHVGYGPDNRIYRELQVHECYASLGPMKLAAALLGESADCLAHGSKGAEVLQNPEPDFFVLGAKSYGRGSAFLIRTGLEQVRDVYTLVDGVAAGARAAPS